MRYFKKLSPQTPVRLTTGALVQFTTLDHVLGYFATDQEAVASEFERCMREGRYDIHEITAEEFMRDYVDKKKAGKVLRAPWRDELTPRMAMPSESLLKERLAAVANAVAVVNPPPPPSVPSALPTQEQPVLQAGTPEATNKDIAARLSPVMKTLKSEFKPVTGKRRQREQPVTT